MSYPVNLRHISTRECPVCETLDIRRVEIRDFHSCGKWNEYLEFECGYTEHFSPNFDTVSVPKGCTHAMRVAVALRAEKNQNTERSVLLSLIREVEMLVGDDGTGDLGIIVRQALVDNPHSTAGDIADIVRQARADAKLDKE